jgi:hypothetical protein
MLPISPALLREEISGAKAILDKWDKQLAEGVPGPERPGGQEGLENFIREMCGELMICAGKCENIVGLFE